MPVYKIADPSKIAHLFEGWEETMIYSYLQGYMGVAYADCTQSPTAAQISLGDFIFFAGEANVALVANKPENVKGDDTILAPPNEAWATVIEAIYKNNAKKHMRYATKKQADVFNKQKLQGFVDDLPPEYQLQMIDAGLYTQIQSLEWAQDLCSNYESFEQYAKIGLGVVALQREEIVAGASSFTSYKGGIEIEIDTREDHRRKGLALACGAKLILACLEKEWYPSWDAHNKASLMLAQKLGYTFDKEYLVYLVEYV